MKNLLLLIFAIILIGCAKDELPEKTNVDQFITFKVIGLYDQTPKQIKITCGGYLLDTVVKGNFIHKVKVHQKIMHSYMRVNTLTPISETLIIEAQGMQSANWNSCEWIEYDIKETYTY